jgi:hypothetical protein
LYINKSKKKKIILLFFIILLHTTILLGHEVEATNFAIAEASPYDYIIRSNGEIVFLTEVDIEFAKNELLAKSTKTNHDIKTSNLKTNDSSSIVVLIVIIFSIYFVLRYLKFRKKIKNPNLVPFDRNNHNTDDYLRTYIDQKGYRRFKDTDRLVHRYLAEKRMGRKLHPEEVVHHRNRNKLDNSEENLQVLENQEEHDKIHKESGWY